MPRTLALATVQLSAQPAPLPERLDLAGGFVIQAAQAGAQVIVLPEVFNTGYEYSSENYMRSETITGRTVSWMTQTAQHLNVHLAGTLFLREKGEIYNAMLLIAPDGQVWRYDKRYPWTWERAYFRPGSGVTVAETSLGRFGMLICWDVAHTQLWAQYAGRVDAILVSSCPPAMLDPMLVFPDGLQLSGRQSGMLFRRMMAGAANVFGSLLRRQSSYLGVPVAITSCTGRFSSHVPLPRLSLGAFFLLNPRAWRLIAQFDKAHLECGFIQDAYVADAAGQVLARVPAETPGFALTTVSLQDTPPHPKGSQPSYGLTSFAYLADRVMNGLMKGIYQRGVRATNGL
jgi:predicted amidohydrolase